MKFLATIVILAGLFNTAGALEQPETLGEVTHTYDGKAAEAMYNNIAGYGVANGPIRLCGNPVYKQELSKDALEKTVCSETHTSTAYGCGPITTTYSCTLTISTNGQKLQLDMLGVAL